MTEPYLKKGCHRVGYVQFKENVDINKVHAAIDLTEVGAELVCSLGSSITADIANT